MEWADLTGEHTSCLLDTDTLLPADAIDAPMTTVIADRQAEMPVLDAAHTADPAGEMPAAD